MSLWSLLSGLLIRPSNIHGSASFLRGPARWRLLSRRHRGLCVDGRSRLSAERSFQHLALVAPTGAGKTTRYIIPNVLGLTGSAVITDPSGEIYQRTAGYLERQGFRVKAVRVADANRSLRFNPLHRATTHTDIKKVADILVRAAFPQSAGDISFWNDGAKNVLNILLRCLKQEDARYQNLHNLRYLLNAFGADGRPLDLFVAEHADRLTFDEYRGFLANDEKVLRGVLATAKTALDKFSDPALCALTAEETLHFETLRAKKTVLYLIVPEHEIRYYGFFLTLLYTQIFAFCMQPPEPEQPYLPIYFLLDEFGNMGALPDFSTVITTLRKRQCSCSIVLQDIAQLENVYGRADASTILHGGCASRLFFPGLSLHTCEELERALGKKTLLYTEAGMHPVGAEADRYRDRELGRSLMTADEIRTMKDGRAILLHGNKRPVLLRMRPYYRDRSLLKKTQIPPKPLDERQGRGEVHYLRL